jgi:hypothetical protein
MLKECLNCHLLKEHHAKGLCYVCYKKLTWIPKTGNCKRCQKLKEMHAKGLCASCYNYVFHLDKNKAYHHRKYNHVDVKTYRELTKACILCGFDKVVDLHHIDRNRQNNSRTNLVGLCPNHHRLIKSARFRLEILHQLKEKGFDMPLEQKRLSKISSPDQP